MGYESIVYIAVPKKDEKELDAILDKHNIKSYGDKNKKYIPLEVGEFGDIKVVKYAIYKLENLKWYDAFSSVTDVNLFIEENEWEDCMNGGRTMFCIGEDNVVHGEIGAYYDMFDVSITVEPYF